MFTGIVQASREIVEVQDMPGLRRLVVALEDLVEGVQRGASVAIDGVCLTATEIDRGERGLVAFDVMQESLEKTTLGELGVGDRVHVERSAKFGDEVGGHIVSGHVTGMAEVISITRPENNFVLELRLPERAKNYVFDKGFIGVKGASLTVVNHDAEANTFEVWLIPETLEITTFAKLAPGERVNIEVDPQTVTIVETVERVMARHLAMQ